MKTIQKDNKSFIALEYCYKMREHFKKMCHAQGGKSLGKSGVGYLGDSL